MHSQGGGGAMTGHGEGWGGDAIQPFSQYVHWTFVYAPPETRNYQVTPHVFFRGVFTVRSFDEAWNSKYASVAAGVIFVDVWQSPDPGGEYSITSGGYSYGHGGDNINLSGRFDLDLAPTVTCPLEGNRLAIIHVYAGFYVLAQGDSSYAELFFAGPNGDCVACPFMHIT